MLHRRAGFPENRVLRCLPDTPEFRLFFSPDIAMANELCSTKDATLDEFKFFVWYELCYCFIPHLIMHYEALIFFYHAL